MPPKLLLIDNLDSFTYNLVHAFETLGAEVQVVSNTVLTAEECMDLQPSWVVIGPGPGTPTNAGISKALIAACAGKIPLLGVCLGHQALAEVYGGVVLKAKRPLHGFLSAIYHHCQGIFQGLPSPFLATRYHSLVVERATLPDCLQITAETENGEIMGLRHLEHFSESIQFHPEALLTEHGLTLLNNFLNPRIPYVTEKTLSHSDHFTVPACLVR